MKTKIAAVAAAGLAAVAMSSGPAQANGGDIQVAGSTSIQPLAGEDGCIYGAPGDGCFYHFGDKIWVKDNAADGLRVIVEYKFNYDRAPGECHQVGGAGTSGECNYQMWEGGKISIRVVTRDGATGPNVHQSPWSPYLKIG
ncbi:hypothetical protein ACWDR0_29290 [Streptomyces sp. NPDC003691]